MTSTPAAVAHTNYTAITITLGIIFIIGAVIAVVVASSTGCSGTALTRWRWPPTASSPRTPSPTSRNCAASWRS